MALHSPIYFVGYMWFSGVMVVADLSSCLRLNFSDIFDDTLPGIQDLVSDIILNVFDLFGGFKSA